MKDFESIDIALLYRKIEEKLTEQESLLFDKWYNESEQHRQWFADFSAQREQIALRQPTAPIDVKAALLKVKATNVIPGVPKQKSSLSIWKWTSVAAAVMMIGFASYMLTSNSRKYSVDQKVVEIKAGSAKAILKLANGKEIVLDKNNPITSVQDNAVEINIADGAVNYAGTSNHPSELIYNELVVPNAGEYQLILADGTKIYLNSGSKLKYPLNFSGNERKVYLEGEAYFNVSHNKKPFIVETRKGTIQVFGTAFNVMSYSDEPEIQTTLVKGSVGVSINGSAYHKITPGQQFAVNYQNGNVSIRDVDVLPYVAWKDGLFVSQNDNLDVIMRKIARWYDVEVYYRDPALKNKQFFGLMKKQEQLSKILEVIAAAGDVKFELKAHRLTIYK